MIRLTDEFVGSSLMRIWQQPVEEVLASGLPVLPLAPVASVEPEQVPGVLLAISERLVQETSPEQAATLWAATKVLMGLRYPNEQVDEFERGVSAMILGIRGIEESSVYQDIFAKGEARGEAKGRVEEARTTLLRLGRKKLGHSSEAIETQINAVSDLDRLNDLLDRILDVSTWEELLASSGLRSKHRSVSGTTAGPANTLRSASDRGSATGMV